VTAAIGAAGLATIAAAILAGALVLLRTRSLGQALPVLLDLLIAAGLLRLAAVPTWSGLAVTAIVIGLRRLITAGIRTASAARRPRGAP
jgi:Protein of unknown function (DUF1622)